ncbi:MAG: DUF433 domain-containing protein [Acidobacteria bacterium]|nr:MAG: DUF433 domain-containing protein [Acidobacteriota bacterium]
MSRATDHPHIVSDANGEPVILETRVTVRAVVELWRIGVRPEEIPDHLPQIGLAQVFDALSYYADHHEHTLFPQVPRSYRFSQVLNLAAD